MSDQSITTAASQVMPVKIQKVVNSPVTSAGKGESVDNMGCFA